MKRKILTIIFSIAAVIAVIAGWIMWSNSTFEETFYTMNSPKIDEPVRLIVLSDPHQAEFGPGNEDLISRIAELKPDALLLAGDVVNKTDTDWDYAVHLCSELSNIAPVYYGMGNHENEALYGKDLNREFLDEKTDLLGDTPEDFTPLLQNPEAWKALENTGAQLLQNSSITVDIRGNAFHIGGIGTNINSFWPYSGQFVYYFATEDTSAFKVLISHRPEQIMKYIPDYAIDLVVSGHNHGGVIRIPGVGGLISGEMELFPTYVEGMFTSGKLSLLISRGLGGHGAIPRIFNKPELVVLDIN